MYVRAVSLMGQDELVVRYAEMSAEECSVARYVFGIVAAIVAYRESGVSSTAHSTFALCTEGNDVVA